MPDKKSSRNIYLQDFREEVRQAALTGDWKRAAKRVLVQLREAPEVILSAKGQQKWKGLQECAKGGALEAGDIWLFIDEEMQHYLELVPEEEVPELKTILLRFLAKMGIVLSGTRTS